jgi:hypothetical protein
MHTVKEAGPSASNVVVAKLNELKRAFTFGIAVSKTRVAPGNQ